MQYERMKWDGMDAVCVPRVILETEASVIASRVTMRGADSDLPLSEQVRHPVITNGKIVYTCIHTCW